MCARCQTDVGVQRGETPAQATRVLSKNAALIAGGFGSDELTQWLEDRKAVLHLSRQPGEDAQISIIRPKLPLCPGRVVTKRAKDVNDAVELAVAAWEAQPLK